MSKHTDPTTAVALRELDPAPEIALTEDESSRADEAFARIVATPADGRVPVEPDRPRRRRTRLLVPLGLAGAAAVAVPALMLGGGTAFATWSPTPWPLAADAAAAAGASCLTSMALPDQGDERVVLAEQRGAWTYVHVAGSRAAATCLIPNELVGRGAAALEGHAFGHGGEGAELVPTVARDGIVEYISSEGSVPGEGWFARDGWFVWVEGYVGRDVTGVTVHTNAGLDIQASVAGNRFAAWWPAELPSSHHPSETWSYTLQLADGSTRRTEG